MTTETNEELVKAAEEVRERLVDTVVRLDHRRHEAVEVPNRIEDFVSRFGLPLGGVAVAGIAALAVYEIVARDRRRRQDRWRLIKTLWRHPDRELRAERRPFAVELMRSLLLTVATSALSIPVRHAVRTVMGSTDHPKSAQ